MRTTQILRDDYESDIPNTPENMCKLPGEFKIIR